jgi:hypothetical protein
MQDDSANSIRTTSNDDDDDDDENHSPSDHHTNKKNTKDDTNDESQYWKTAVCPKPGRTYCYHTLTRQTQWQKPLCCASESERQAIRIKEQQTRDFFASLEQNILKMMMTASSTTSSLEEKEKEETKEERTGGTKEEQAKEEDEDEACQAESSDPNHPTPLLPPRKLSLVRTISTMQGEVLAALIPQVPTSPSFDDTPFGMEHQQQDRSSSSMNQQRSSSLSSLYLRYKNSNNQNQSQNHFVRTSLMNVVVMEDDNEDLSSHSNQSSNEEQDPTTNPQWVGDCPLSPSCSVSSYLCWLACPALLIAGVAPAAAGVSAQASNPSPTARGHGPQRVGGVGAQKTRQ